MTDLGDGVHVSQVASEEFESDEETGGLVHWLFDDGEAMAGLWKPHPDRSSYPGHVIPARETIVVVSGTVRIEIEDGPTLELATGDMASLPKGAVTTWHPSPDFREVWVYS